MTGPSPAALLSHSGWNDDDLIALLRQWRGLDGKA